MGAGLDLTMETAIGGRVCGVDEAGRGPLAGPVVAAAVMLDARRVPAGLADSKKLAPARREELARALAICAQIGVGAASVAEIDRLNILQATLLAMRRAVAALPHPPDHALVDGNRLPDLPCPASAIVRGDERIASIAAASIVAKVVRDRLMRLLARRYPVYRWENNKGYGTADHLAALARFGASRHHRLSFAPVHGVMTQDIVVRD
jgi:ribonuclease HII